jgi:AcrR family transcriptional regulator
VPRPLLHSTDAILDAARGLLIKDGARAATVAAIAEAGGIPVGSIYHRFGSTETLITMLWIRAVHRSQGAFVAAMDHSDPTEAAVAAALSILDFCREHPADARLLASYGREELLGATPTGRLAEELAELNRPVERAVTGLAERLYFTRARRALDRTTLAVFDIPYGATKRHLVAGAEFPARLRRDLETAVRALVNAPL